MTTARTVRSRGASEEAIARTCQTITRAEATRPSANPIGGAADVERDLVDAPAERFSGPEPVEDFAPWKLAYADAMAGVRARHPDGLDVAALYADAMMNLTPWQLWPVATGEPAAGARTLEIKRVLEQALGLPGGMAHPGLLHRRRWGESVAFRHCRDLTRRHLGILLLALATTAAGGGAPGSATTASPPLRRPAQLRPRARTAPRPCVPRGSTPPRPQGAF